jgi:hypothetical protein
MSREARPMALTSSYVTLDGEPLVRLESEHLQADVAPGIGGRIVSLREKAGGHEFLWRNERLRLQRVAPGSTYDPNFYGGIDELLPNDAAERIDGVDCPDHGELWTMALDWQLKGACLILEGRLPRFGLDYRRQMCLAPDRPTVEFHSRISNPTDAARHFLWNFHAALAVEPGDVIECPAETARVADPAWSRRQSQAPFRWPMIEGRPANVVPAADGTCDSFYLYQMRSGRIAWRRPSQELKLGYRFDTRVFPYASVWASYGGFDGHYMMLLEPSTALPNRVGEAIARNQCAVLTPGEVLETEVFLDAGRDVIT